jgi:hypothetical protein
MFDGWRGKRTASGPILGPETPAKVEKEPVGKPAPAELPEPHDPEAQERG